jgi:hypothetical protein
LAGGFNIEAKTFCPVLSLMFSHDSTSLLEPFRWIEFRRNWM